MQDFAQLKHILLLQLENRLFEHVLGVPARENPPIEVHLDVTNGDNAGRRSLMAELDRELAAMSLDRVGRSSKEVDRQLASSTAAGFVRNFQDLFPRNPYPEIAMQYLPQWAQPFGNLAGY